jgi:serine/threonine protein kinase
MHTKMTILTATSHVLPVQAAAAVEREVETRAKGSPFVYQQRQVQEANGILPPPVVDWCHLQRTGQLLGHGNFAEVLQVTIINDDDSPQTSPEKTNTTGTSQKTYALKQLLTTRKDNQQQHNSFSYDDHRKKLFQAAVDLAMEAKYLSCMDHPNIIKLRGISQCWERATSFILMDQLTETLDQRISQWKQEARPQQQTAARWHEIATYALQIASAISYVHGFRIILRDIKTANIGFLSRSTIQLFDFGTCRELPFMPVHGTGDNSCYRMSMVGTRGYMAPEIMNHTRGCSCYGLKADVYSWAIVLYEMATLEQETSDALSLAAHKQFLAPQGERPTCLDPQEKNGSIIPKKLKDLIRKAWAQDVSERLSMREASEQLQSLLVDTTDWNDPNTEPQQEAPSIYRNIHQITVGSDHPSRKMSSASNRLLSSYHQQVTAKTTATCA